MFLHICIKYIERRREMKKFILRFHVEETETDDPPVLITEMERSYTCKRYVRSALHQIANRKLKDWGNRYHIFCTAEDTCGNDFIAEIFGLE